MLKATRLLKYEYFPEELPECFSSKGLADNYNVLKGQAESISIPSSPFLFSIYKGNNARRRMAIPNPLSYMRLVKCITDNCDEIISHFYKSTISLTKPSFDQRVTKKRAYNRISNTPDETRLANEKLFSNNSICIKLDISNFFDSIYTHSVAWAIHTKEVAKVCRDDNSKLGNKIDKALQNLNDMQTHGILVGNAASRLVAEIILCNVDYEIAKHFPNVNICRFVDDYSFYLTEKESPTAIISFVRNQLLEYDLVLNEAKTKIINAPFLIERTGIDEIKSIATADAYTYYNRMMLLFDKYNDLSLLKYGFSIIDLILDESSFSKVFPLLVHSWVTFPALANKILPIIYRYKDCMNTTEKKELKKALTSIIFNGIELRQEAETVWAVWAMTLFAFPIREDIIRCICESNNDFAIVIALSHVKEKNYKYYQEVTNQLVERIKDESSTPTDSNRAEIFFSHWFLIYELVRKEIVSIDIFPCVKDVKFFKKLLELKVDFFDSSVVPSTKEVASQAKKDHDEIVALLQGLIISENNNPKKTELIDSIANFVQGKSEKWIYE